MTFCPVCRGPGGIVLFSSVAPCLKCEPPKVTAAAAIVPAGTFASGVVKMVLAEHPDTVGRGLFAAVLMAVGAPIVHAPFGHGPSGMDMAGRNAVAMNNRGDTSLCWALDSVVRSGSGWSIIRRDGK